MTKKIKKIIAVLLLLAITIGSSSLAITKKLLINDDTFSFNVKEEKILSNFDDSYNISNNNDTSDNELKQTITDLTKKTTYLLLGEPNRQTESSENYYKRHKDYLALRYNPEVPKDEESSLGLDENSQEYKDDILSGISVPGMFIKLNELEVKYNSYGDIRITKVDEEKVVSIITLSNVKMKEQDLSDPMNYITVQTDLTMYYYFKKLNNEYKLLYLYGETNDDIQEYINSNEEKSGELSKNTDYNSELRDLYDFSKSDNITEETLNKIYSENKNKVVFLNSTYNIGTVASANGFFITEGLVMTTYNYIEESLMKAQKITISDNLGNVYDLDGIVTINIENDIAILKVKNKNQNYIEVQDVSEIAKEDAVITLNTKTGVGLTTGKGIVTLVDKNIQTSLPMSSDMQGSPLFNSDGKLIGMMNTKLLNSSISYATKLDIIKEYFNKFNTINYDEIKAVPFKQLKENYYIKYSDESILNNVPQEKIKEYSNVDKIDEIIGLKLIKSSYKDGIISLRYKNDIKNYIDTMQFSAQYVEILKKKGFNAKYESASKLIYENEKYQIIITEEFDYLIIVMVRL